MPELMVGALGRGVVPDGPLLHADDLGATRGDGCFEGTRVRCTAAGPEVDDLDAHLARMARSAGALGLAFGEAAWRELVADLARAWAGGRSPGEEGSLKLVLTRGREGTGVPTGYATVAPIPAGALRARRDGVRVSVLSRGLASDAFAGAPWLLGGVKLLSYAIHMAAQREALARGDDDAIFASTDGQLLETPSASVVWLHGSTLSTVAPSAGNGILRSITTERLLRQAPAAGFEPRWTTGTVADLYAADLVLLVSSARGPVQVRTLDGLALTSTDPGRRALMTCRRLLDF